MAEGGESEIMIVKNRKVWFYIQSHAIRIYPSGLGSGKIILGPSYGALYGVCYPRTGH